MSRIVVKVGSNVLTRHDGKPDITHMSELVDQIAALIKQGHEVVLVSSGAVACGRGSVTPKRELDAVEERQLFSAVGQIQLINLYSQFFITYGIVAAQVLTQKDNFSSRTSYLNQRRCLLTLLENGVVPILNENDTVSLSELMFTDNDELSGLVATMIDADFLVILSNIDGIYTGAPGQEGSELIPVVKPQMNLDDYVCSTRSSFGRGGMRTKCNIASKVASEGISVIIAKGTRPNVLVDLLNTPDSVPHTLFEPTSQSLSPVKRWIAHSGSFAKGKIIINSGAADVLRSDKAVSLLPIGVTGIEGEWEEGDLVSIYSDKGEYIGVGKANTDSSSAASFAGMRGGKPLVHYDYLYIE